MSVLLHFFIIFLDEFVLLPSDSQNYEFIVAAPAFVIGWLFRRQLSHHRLLPFGCEVSASDDFAHFGVAGEVFCQSVRVVHTLAFHRVFSIGLRRHQLLEHDEAVSRVRVFGVPCYHMEMVDVVARFDFARRGLVAHYDVRMLVGYVCEVFLLFVGFVHQRVSYGADRLLQFVFELLRAVPPIYPCVGFEVFPVIFPVV